MRPFFLISVIVATDFLATCIANVESDQSKILPRVSPGFARSLDIEQTNDSPDRFLRIHKGNEELEMEERGAGTIIQKGAKEILGVKDLWERNDKAISVYKKWIANNYSQTKVAEKLDVTTSKDMEGILVGYVAYLKQTFDGA